MIEQPIKSFQKHPTVVNYWSFKSYCSSLNSKFKVSGASSVSSKHIRSSQSFFEPFKNRSTFGMYRELSDKLLTVLLGRSENNEMCRSFWELPRCFWFLAIVVAFNKISNFPWSEEYSSQMLSQFIRWTGVQKSPQKLSSFTEGRVALHKLPKIFICLSQVVWKKHVNALPLSGVKCQRKFFSFVILFIASVRSCFVAFIACTSYRVCRNQLNETNS